MTAYEPECGTLLPPTASCVVRNRLQLAHSVVELREYSFDRPGRAIVQSPKYFFDLALSQRGGHLTGCYLGIVDAKPRPLGELVFVPAHLPLSVEWSAGRHRSLYCGFTGGRPDENDVYAPSELEISLDIRNAFIREGMLRLAREIEAPGYKSESLTGALWIAACVELGRYMRNVRGLSGDSRRLSAEQLRLVDNWLEVAGPLPPVANLARQCGLSDRHFRRVFRATTGQPFSNYAAEKRIERAKHLLSTAQLPIKQIAWQCGFETSDAFAAAFRRIVGETPAEYRRARVS